MFPVSRHFVSRPHSLTVAAIALLTIALAARPAPGQTPSQPAAAPQAATVSTPPQSFEVASVRLCPKDYERRSWNSYPANRVYYHNLTLDIVLADAFDHDNTYIVGPDWLKDQCYVIDAKVEGDKQLSKKDVRPLLRTLLEQRFHLVVHHETRMVSGYALVSTKNQPKLQPSKPDDPYFGYIFQNLIRESRSNLENFAGSLAAAVRSPVVDKTGIQGVYTFDLHYATADHPDPNLPDIFTAVREQLGLKLQPEKVSVDFLVIDHVDKIPTEN